MVVRAGGRGKGCWECDVIVTLRLFSLSLVKFSQVTNGVSLLAAYSQVTNGLSFPFFLSFFSSHLVHDSAFRRPNRRQYAY